MEVCRRWLPRVMMTLTNDELRGSSVVRQQALMQVEQYTNLLFCEPRVVDWVYQNFAYNTLKISSRWNNGSSCRSFSSINQCPSPSGKTRPMFAAGMFAA